MESGNLEKINVPLETIEFPVRGVYKTRDGMLPKRMCYLHPDAIRSFYQLQRYTDFKLRYSDIFRKPESSFLARKEKGRSVAPPGKSGHNYGVSFDIDVEHALRLFTNNKNPRGKRLLELQDKFVMYDWYPLNSVRNKLLRDPGRKRQISEEWHFNYGEEPISSRVEQWYSEVELDVAELQSILLDLGYNAFPIDGIYGKNTRKAMNAFQKDCRIPRTKYPDRNTKLILSSLDVKYTITNGAASY